MNDEAAFAAFYRATSAGLWRYLRRIAGDAADDLVQESYVRYLGAPAAGGGGCGERSRAYLFRIATNLARDRWRRDEAAAGAPRSPVE